MKDYIFKRLLLTVPTIFGLTVIVFLLVRFLPGDVIDAMSGGEVAIDEGRRKMIMDRLGLNDPIIVQYGNWLKDIFSGDLGVSLRNAQPLREVRFLPTIDPLGDQRSRHWTNQRHRWRRVSHSARLWQHRTYLRTLTAGWSTDW